MRTILLLGSVIGIIAPAGAGESSDSTRSPLSPAGCRRLVEQLASSEKPPFTDRYVHDLPKGLGESVLRSRQKPIEVAYNRLSRGIDTALPTLASHLQDKRFSYVYEDGISGVYEKATVGQACTKIIATHVEVYRPLVTKFDDEGRSRSLWFIQDGCGGFEKWWETRQGKPLAELQFEGIEWALRQERPDHFDNPRDWAKAKRSLEKLAGTIRSTKRPIPVEHDVQFFSR